MPTTSRPGILFATVVCLFALLAEAPAMAQTFRGGIQGTITDTTGGALPGTTVTVAIETQHGTHKTVHLKLGEFPGG